MSDMWKNRPELSVQEVRNTNPLAVRKWDFNAQFEKVFSDGNTKQRLLVERNAPTKRYNRIK